MIKGKAKKGILITVITLFVVVALIIGFISPIAKYLVEKYDVKYLGREIKMDWLYLNPFTGYVHISNLRVYEANSDSLFLTADGLSAKFDLFKILEKTYEISSITLNRPVIYMIQNRKELNFADLIERFKPKPKADSLLPKEPRHFNILNIAVTDGEFHYTEKSIPINYFIKKLNVESAGKRWDVDSMNVKFALQSGPGSGDIKGNACINLDSLTYRVAATITKFDLSLMEQYLHDLANYGHLAAFLDLDIKATGSVKDKQALDLSGIVTINDFHFGEKAGNDFASFDKLVLNIDEVNPKNFKFYFDSLMIARFFFKYEKYDELNNIEQMFGKNGSKIQAANADPDKFNLIIEVAKYIKELSKNFLKSRYKVNRLALYNCDVKFNDYSLREKFSAEANPLNISADSIDKNHKRLKLVLYTGIKPYGNLAVNVSIDPNDYGNFNIQYKILKVPISMFNPYIITYTSFPFDRGSLEFNGSMNVADSIIQSENHLLILDPRVGQRIKRNDTKWVPVPFIMSLVRSSGAAIDFKIPIAGNLKNPKFKFWDVARSVLSNIFVKPPSTAYLVKVKQLEQDVEKSLTLKWMMHQTVLEPVQAKFVKRMSEYLNQHSDALITISPMIYTEKEKEDILLFEGKKKYFLQTRNLKEMSMDDSVLIDKMSVKDSMFVRYLNKSTGNAMMFTAQEKCDYVVGKGVVAAKLNQLRKERERVFRSYFNNPIAQVKFKKDENTIPFNGFSYYKIDYHGNFPEALMKAYWKLEDLDDDGVRGKYKDKRKAEPE